MSTSDKHQVGYAAVVSAEQAADYFESIAAGIRQHVMLVESGNDSMELDVGETMKLEAEFNAGEKKSSIEFELSWRQAEGRVIGPPELHVVTPSEAKTLRGMSDDDAAVLHSMTPAERDALRVGAETKPARRPVAHARTARSTTKTKATRSRRSRSTK